MTQAIYRRYRPQTFDQVIGQEQVTGPLKNALKSGRVNHAYLFSGPRGCGKTTSARIMARCLNCEQGPTDTPCEVCPSCVELSVNGSGSLDVVEIDAASHNGVDDARALRENAFFAPVRDRYKIFILDEAHMVTTQGFNALLKLVEEPPEHVKFIFATTEPEKVITTIRSRTHHYPFRLVAPQTLRNFLSHVCDLENVQYDNSVISLIVRAGAGSVRDSLSILDQIIAGSEDNVLDYEKTRHLLGYTDTAMLDSIVESFAAKDGAVVYEIVEKIVDSGQDPRRFVEDLLQKIRDLILIYIAGVNSKNILSTYSDEQLNRMYKQAKGWGIDNLNDAAQRCVEALSEMVGATSARIHLELLCARIIVPALSDSNTVNLELNQTTNTALRTGNDTVSNPRNDTYVSIVENADKSTISRGVNSDARNQSVEALNSVANSNDNSNIVVSDKGLAETIDIPKSVLEDSNLSVQAHVNDDEFNTLAKTKKPGDLLAPANFGKPIVMPEKIPDVEAVQEQREEQLSNQYLSNPNLAEPTGEKLQEPLSSSRLSETDSTHSFDNTNTVESQIQASDKATDFTQDFDTNQPYEEFVATNNVDSYNQQSVTAKSELEENLPKTTQGNLPSNIGNVQSDLIRLRWEEILEKIKNTKKSTWTLISRNAQPGAYDGKTLHLHFDTKALAGMFSSGPHIQVTIQSIHDILGINVQINPTDEAVDLQNAQGLSDVKVTQTGVTATTGAGGTVNFTEQNSANNRQSLVEEAERSFQTQPYSQSNSSANFRVQHSSSPNLPNNAIQSVEEFEPTVEVFAENGSFDRVSAKSQPHYLNDAGSSAGVVTSETATNSNLETKSVATFSAQQEQSVGFSEQTFADTNSSFTQTSEENVSRKDSVQSQNQNIAIPEQTGNETTYEDSFFNDDENYEDDFYTDEMLVDNYAGEENNNVNHGENATTNLKANADNDIDNPTSTLNTSENAQVDTSTQLKSGEQNLDNIQSKPLDIASIQSMLNAKIEDAE